MPEAVIYDLSLFVRSLVDLRQQHGIFATSRVLGELSYEAASGNFSEVQEAHQDSELLKDVTDAEGMYIRRYFQLCGAFNCCYNLAFQWALNR